MADQASRAVFLSYASQDAEAARRICETLRTAGIEVWFDQSELRGGDAWDHRIRQQIRDCVLFIPVISAATVARGEGYFRLEWSLADQRTQMMARTKAFIVPVCIDGTTDAGADVPDSFLRVQWTRLPGGATPASFCERIVTLLQAPGGAAPGPVPVTASGTAASAPARVAQRRPAKLLLGAALAALLMVALLAWHPWRSMSAASLHDPAHADSADQPPAAGQKSVAVLPFADMSEKHDQEYFSDGLAEELIDVLARIPQLRVPARTSSFSFKGRASTVGEIARALGVTYVLEGSVRKSGEHLRIGAQLVRADNGFHLWTQTYDRDVRDVFAVQDDIAQSVSEKLKLTLLTSPSSITGNTTNPEAHNLYLQARYVMARDAPADLDQAVRLYERALALDPGYAPAWAWLAFCHTRRVAQGLDTHGGGFQKTADAARRALSIDPNVTEAYVAQAIAHLQYDLDFAAASQELTRARAIDPNDALAQQISGHLTGVTGRMSDAFAYYRRAMEADPLNLLNYKYGSRALLYGRRPTEAVALSRHGLEINPAFPGLHYELGRALLMLNEVVAAQAAFAGETDESWKYFGPPLAYHAARQDQAAQAAVAVLLAHADGAEFQVAETYAYLGQTDKAFEWLEKARTQHDPGIIWLRRDPFLATLVKDARYAAFLARAGIPAAPQDD